MKINLPYMPPSSNNAYTNLRGGGRVLSEKGKSFKLSSTAYILAHHSNELMKMDRTKKYKVSFVFYFEQLETKGWPKTAKDRYKPLDLSNRVKLVEDALKDATGVDDKNTFAMYTEKRVGLPERVEIEVEEMP